MAKQPYIDLTGGVRIPILHEDRNVIAIDKPAGWMLAPITWQNTGRNLFAALTSSMNGGDFWAASRSLKFIRFVHRLDADTSGVLLLVKTPGAMPAYTELFEDRKVRKTYLAVVHGVPEPGEWRCELRLAPVADQPGRMEVNDDLGKDAETFFRVVAARDDRALLLCWPKTGRTHQIRVHLAAIGHPVRGDQLYGPVPAQTGERIDTSLALRAISVSYEDPFQAVPVHIKADFAEFVRAHGFDPNEAALQNPVTPAAAPEHPKGRRPIPERRSRAESHPRDAGAPRHARSQAGRDWAETEAGEEDFAARRDFAARPPRKFPPRPPTGERRFGRSDERRPYPARAEGGRFFGGPPRPRREEWDERAPRPFRPREFEARGNRRPDYQRGEARPPGGGFQRGFAGREREENRPGVFRSSARTGLRSGFRPGGYAAGEDRPYGSARPGARPAGRLGGGRPYDAKPHGGGKPHGGNPAWKGKPPGRSFKKFSGPR